MNSSTSSFKHFFITTVLTLTILLVVVLCAVEWHLQRQIAHRDGEMAYRQVLFQGVAPWVAIGDSHTANGLVTAEWLDNLGKASDNLDSMLGKLSIRESRPNLKGVILSADAQVFAFYRLTADQSARMQDLLRENPAPLFFFQPQYRQYLLETVLSILSNPSVLWRPKSSSGEVLVPLVSNTPKWDKMAILRAQLHTPVRNIDMLPAALQYRKIVKEMKNRGFRVCLVAYPLSSAYRRETKAIPTFAEAKTFFASVAAESGAHFIDATETIPDSLFEDPDHLSPHGAEEFTLWLHKMCVEKGD